MKHDSFNESTEMYLKTVVELANGAGKPVPISALADRLGVSTVSATEMIHRLQDQDLLAHTPYKGVSLTAKGQRWATALIRAHHMWECLLVDKLGLPWEKAHDYACRLEHATETAVTEALAVFLNNPAACPHGNPIPGPDGVAAIPDDVALTAVQAGQSGVIQRIYPESNLLLDYLAGRDLKPGNAFTVSEIAPFHGPIMLDCCGQTHALGQEVAAHIFVRIDAKDVIRDA
jgi:DtxR family transcriptional regulator, Mn-dependent transcriptional regulator